ncbi:amidohydrolase family protein [Pseudonocardia sp. NPDC046786]|uniref:amidohydrolase family protein n=1 Tax=Pseudonocardia sp. NPDC046786 TaxID=3155471 RepID=UPI0033F92BB3
MLVDSHVHLFTAELPPAGDAWTVPERALPVEEFETLMRRHGVTHGVVSAMSLLDDDTYTLAALRRNPRLRGTVSAGPGTDPARLRARCTSGVVGIRFQWRRRPELPDPADPGYRRVLDTAADLGMHVELNVERDRMAPVLAGLCGHGVSVVVDHFGDPHPELGYRTPGGEALLRALDTGRVRVKLSAGYRFRVPAERLAGNAAELIARAGPDRVFWGSDAPFVGAREPTGYPAELAAFTRIVPDRAVRERIHTAAHDYYFGPVR